MLQTVIESCDLLHTTGGQPTAASGTGDTRKPHAHRGAAPGALVEAATPAATDARA